MTDGSLEVASLFSGVGGIDLGLEKAGHRVVFQCEWEPWRRRVLSWHWPDVTLAPDVREVGGGDAPEVDLLCGGFPCQDLSVAGKRRGLAGERSSLFFDFARIADELVRPGGWVLVENVPGLLSGCSCVGCEKCRELLRLHSLGWSRVGVDAGRGFGQLHSQLGLADDLAGDCGDEADAGEPDAARRSPGRCPCRRCDEARRLLADHDGTEFAVVRSVLGEIGFHDLAWRVLDSRYFGVPQRRRRVFILGRRARGRRAAEVLLEPESGGGDFEASEATKARTSLLAEGGAVQALDRKGGGADDNEAQAGHLIAGTVRSHVRPGSNDTGGIVAAPEVAAPLTKGSATGEGVSVPGRRQEDDQNLVAHTLRAEGFDASEDGTGRGTPFVIDPQGPEGEGRRGDGAGGDYDPGRVPHDADPDNGGGEPGAEQGIERGLREHGSPESGRSPEVDPDRVREAAGVSGRVDVGAFNLRGRDDGAQAEPDDLASLRASSGGSSRSYVYGGGDDADRCAFDPLPDGPRYAACGDAVTVNVAEWIGNRLRERA